jgi:hypothetical protein
MLLRDLTELLMCGAGILRHEIQPAAHHDYAEHQGKQQNAIDNHAAEAPSLDMAQMKLAVLTQEYYPRIPARVRLITIINMELVIYKGERLRRPLAQAG